MGLGNSRASYPHVILRWLIDYFQTEEILSPYQETLISVLSRLWEAALAEAAQNSRASMLALPMVCCEALTKDPQLALEVNAAWSLVYAAFHLLDKVEDQEGEGDLFSPGESVVVNVSTGFLLSAGRILSRIEDQHIPSGTINALQSAFYRSTLVVCAGQHNDLRQNQIDLLGIWSVADAKSGEFFSLGCQVGALVATADPDLVNAFSGFGRYLGILLQISNDIQGLWAQRPGQSDLAKGKLTLPVAYALHVQDENGQKELLRQISLAKDDPSAEASSRNAILRCGALVYLKLEAERHWQRANSLLESTGLPEERVYLLHKILNQVGKLRLKTGND